VTGAMSSEPTRSYDDAGIVQLLSAYDSKGATGDAQRPEQDSNLRPTA
jgi:hypothetical protein